MGYAQKMGMLYVAHGWINKKALLMKKITDLYDKQCQEKSSQS